MKTVLVRLLIPILIVQVSANLSAESVAINSLLNSLGAELEWEPLHQIGRLSLGPREATFRLGTPFVVLDSTVRLPSQAIYREGGVIMLPEETARAVALHLTGEVAAAGAPRVAAVMIDPGHGGKDPGAIGRHQIDGRMLELREKDIVLGVSRELREMLVRRFPAKDIVLTREQDNYLSLEERTEKANGVPLGESEAIIFISIHVNAALKRSADGFEVWYLPPDYKRDLSDRTGVDTDSEEIIPILSTMLEEQYNTESVLLARDILQGLDQGVGADSVNRGLKEEIWFVVRNSKMPAVLVELGFITNPEEGEHLSDPDYLRRLAEGIYNGVVKFIQRFESSRGFTKAS